MNVPSFIFQFLYKWMVRLFPVFYYFSNAAGSILFRASLYVCAKVFHQGIYRYRGRIAGEFVLFCFFKQWLGQIKMASGRM